MDFDGSVVTMKNGMFYKYVCGWKKIVLLISWNFDKSKKMEMVDNMKLKKDGSRNWLSSFCMYKLYELDYFYVPIYYNKYVHKID